MMGTDDTMGGAAPAPAHGERVLVRLPVHLAQPSHKVVLRNGPKPAKQRGRVPRVARLLALAHHFQDLLDTGAVANQSALAAVAGLTRARVTQILNLRYLAPDIQEEILLMPRVTAGRTSVSEPMLRDVLQAALWPEQRRRWRALRGRFARDAGASPSVPAEDSAGSNA